MTQTRAQREHRETVITELREMVKRGDTVYTILRSVSRSGMTRYYDLFVMIDNEPVRITYKAAIALGWTYNAADALKVTGCGMDMGFHTVYSLSAVLFGYGDRGAYDLTERKL